MNNFEKGELKENLKIWWKSLENNRGLRSELRRAKSVHEIVLQGSFHSDFYKHFGTTPVAQNLEQMASVMGLLSHVESCSEDNSVAKQMARSGGESDKPVVHEIRFKKLLKSSREDLYRDMIRVIRLLNKNSINIYSLAHAVFYWGDNIKKQWAYDYYSFYK